MESPKVSLILPLYIENSEISANNQVQISIYGGGSKSEHPLNPTLSFLATLYLVCLYNMPCLALLPLLLCALAHIVTRGLHSKTRKMQKGKDLNRSCAV